MHEQMHGEITRLMVINQHCDMVHGMPACHCLAAMLAASQIPSIPIAMLSTVRCARYLVVILCPTWITRTVI